MTLSMVTQRSTGKECLAFIKMEFKEKGQISIFFSSTIIVMITFMAFIINIGMFVKAKINLQNATDSAAYAGASVQARQLTNIAYMNWELRNVYKEWMFKYYVLGSLNLQNVTSPSGTLTDFRMSSFARTENSADDRYNFPSTCIDFASTGGVGLCTKYLVPGLPRFESSNVLGMDETTNAFVDAIVAEKSNNCSVRSKLNFLTANLWAYNVFNPNTNLNNLQAESPEITADRMGAFPHAFEVAARIRNLEFQVNSPPINGACMDVSTGIDCRTSISELSSPSRERTLKALQSGWRNLGVHGSDAGEGGTKFMKDSFTITELAPKPDPNIKTVQGLSTLLIPPGSPALDKFYLDLQLMVVNYTTLYTSFNSKKSESGEGLTTSVGTVGSEGQCAATKVGLPVPGYPLGFVKNPNTLTYYAIESKVNFVGLFNPFSNNTITLTAYAAAKPFGGRIGPMIFDISDGQTLKARSNRLSAKYISGLNVDDFKDSFGNVIPKGTYAPGMPIPVNIDDNAGRYWLKTAADPVGGLASSSGLFFGIPNLLFDYPDGSFQNAATYEAPNSRLVQEIELQEGPVGSGIDGPTASLYNRDMFELFKNKLRGIGGTVDVSAIEDALEVSRAPTLYEAHNYLVPTPESLNLQVGTDSWGAITGEPIRDITDGASRVYDIYNMELYAPLFGDADVAIYAGADAIADELERYLAIQEKAIEKYKNSMNIVAAAIFTGNVSGATGENTGKDAAVEISDLPADAYRDIAGNPDLAANFNPTCASIAGKFIAFYLGSGSSLIGAGGPPCPTSIRDLMQTRWADPSLTGDLYQENRYAFPRDLQEELFTAYRPGPTHDAGEADGVQTNTLNGRPDKMIRNFYSTKFIPLKSLTPSDDSGYKVNTMPIYSEGEITEAESDTETKRTSFVNTLDDTTLSRPLEELNH